MLDQGLRGTLYDGLGGGGRGIEQTSSFQSSYVKVSKGLKFVMLSLDME